MKFTSDGKIIWTLDGGEKTQKFKADRKTRRCQHILGGTRKPHRQCPSTANFDTKKHCKTHSKDFVWTKKEAKLLRKQRSIKDQLKRHRARGA